MRKCIRCGISIDKCMGFVLARDLVSAMDGLIPWTSVREHCGMCCEKVTTEDLLALPAFPVSETTKEEIPC